MKRYVMASLVGATVLTVGSIATAKDATCFTSDDGEYACSFKRLDEAGSFRISAPDKPTFELWIEGEGEGFASATFTPGGRSVALPGTYVRSKKDRACWVSDETDTEICAW